MLTRSTPWLSAAFSSMIVLFIFTVLFTIPSLQHLNEDLVAFWGCIHMSCSKSWHMVFVCNISASSRLSMAVVLSSQFPLNFLSPQTWFGYFSSFHRWIQPLHPEAVLLHLLPPLRWSRVTPTPGHRAVYMGWRERKSYRTWCERSGAREWGRLLWP